MIFLYLPSLPQSPLPFQCSLVPWYSPNRREFVGWEIHENQNPMIPYSELWQFKGFNSSQARVQQHPSLGNWRNIPVAVLNRWDLRPKLWGCSYSRISAQGWKWQNWGMAEVGRGLWRSSGPTPCPSRVRQARLCPGGFWLSPCRESLQHPWKTYQGVWPTSQQWRYQGLVIMRSKAGKCSADNWSLQFL